ncbi:hypothetical protein H0H93_005993 [Arthromyces matolae]|nr:hypothetical protein H0H93_005993 [Arthromyces matolae]
MSSHFTPEIPLGSKLGAAFIGNLVAAVNNDRDRQWFKGVVSASLPISSKFRTD